MLKSYWYTTQEILLSSAISQAEVMSLAAASCGTRMYQESRITVSPSTQFKAWCKETLSLEDFGYIESTFRGCAGKLRQFGLVQELGENFRK